MRGLGGRSGVQPVATLVLGGVSVVVFALTHQLGRAVPFTRGSLRFSALDGYSTFGPYIAELGEWWRIVTGTFLHIDLRHLLFNMLVLYLLGRRLEGVTGRALLVGIYAVSLVGGSAGALLLRPDVAAVGASGAVYGLMGAAYLVELLRGGNPWRDGLGSLILINVALSFLIPNISIGGHLGGLVAGALCGVAIGDTRRRRHPPTLAERLSPELTVETRTRRSPYLVWALVALLGAAAFLGALAAAGTWRNPLF
ncbi:rhomboid family intramembrane serine protease [Candidatus Poriferisodalis sp.]|uniref:rhomboid family intramembrane serine protease n=1 Tax=Candidatus Poriferisodalis sp. TaxID=3101277 RepID=UPI003B029EFF